MNLKITILFLCLFSLFQYEVQACAPFTTNQIIVGKYNGLVDNTVPDREGNFQFIDFLNNYKPFPGNNTELGKYYFIDTNRIDLSNYKKGDLVITISSYDDGFYDEYFTIYELGKISCNSNNEISIVNREGMLKEFGRKIWTCGDVPDYILSEKEVLAKINNVYNVCTNSEEVSNNIDTTDTAINEVEIIDSIENEKVVNKDNIQEVENNISDIELSVNHKESTLEQQENKFSYLWVLLFIIPGVGLIYLLNNKSGKE